MSNIQIFLKAKEIAGFNHVNDYRIAAIVQVVPAQINLLRLIIPRRRGEWVKKLILVL
jgi:hypothetical protein